MCIIVEGLGAIILAPVSIKLGNTLYILNIRVSFVLQWAKMIDHKYSDKSIYDMASWWAAA